MAAYSTPHVRSDDSSDQDVMLGEDLPVNITEAFLTLFASRNLAPTQVREQFDRVSKEVQKVMCFLVLLRPYYSRITDSNLGVRGAHMKTITAFDVADEDGTYMTLTEFRQMMDVIVIKDTSESKVSAVRKFYTCLPDRVEVRKFALKLLLEDINGVRIDYAFFIRFYPHTEPWFYMWPRLGDRMIIGCVRPYISDTQPLDISYEDEDAPKVMAVPSKEEEYMQKKWDGHRHYLIICSDETCYLMSRKGLVRRAPEGWPFGENAKKVSGPPNNAGDFEELSSRQDILTIYDGELIARDRKTKEVLPATSVSSLFRDLTMFATYIIFDTPRLNGEWVDHLPLRERIALLKERFVPVHRMSEEVGTICLTRTMKASYHYYTTEDRVEGVIYKMKTSRYGGVFDFQKERPERAYELAYLPSEKTSEQRKFKWGSDEVTVCCLDGKRGNGKLSGVISSLSMCVLFEGRMFYIGAVSITNSKYHKMLESYVEKGSDGQSLTTDGLPNALHLSGITGAPAQMTVKGVKCRNSVKFSSPLYLDVLGDAGIEFERKGDVVQVNIRNVRPVRFREEDDCVVTDITQEVLACALRTPTAEEEGETPEGQ